ncbi:hypothetical protein [Rhodanobacter sp. L36]|uniref:hypothetical protein n=1 Tax=Rhodanobacter sp. L36 TaxID=1747221 RepID=UPI00131D8B78|nr:hypothetical protein [Rhodanobacter sp. L36]
MKCYANLSGNSGITGYQIGDASIRIRFVNGDIYEYDATSPGYEHVQNMQLLAQAGEGLATYISRFVHDDYARKLD